MNWLRGSYRRICQIPLKLDELAKDIDIFLEWVFLTIGECIREVRCVCNLTQEGLAERLGVDVRTVQRWEADEQIPRKRLLYQLREQILTLDTYMCSYTYTNARVELNVELGRIISDFERKRAKRRNRC
jgi:transcriptional regulator with XRE-family HTH domain